MIALRRLWSLKRDQRGMVAPFVAVIGTVLVLSAGIALDVGAYYVGNRDLRSATEAAALAAAVALKSDPTHVEARAREYLSKNGYTDPAVLQSIEYGRYCADGRPNANAAARFDLNGAGQRCAGSELNAVRLHTSKPSRQFLTRALGSASPIPALDATATAARIDEAGIGITTGVLGISGISGQVLSLTNTILSSLLGPGVTLNLDSSQLSALLSTNVDAAKFFRALGGTDQNITYGEVAKSTVSLPVLLAAAQAASGGSPPPALTGAIAKFAGFNNVQVPLTDLFHLGVWENMPIGDPNQPQNLRAGLNAYQLITYALQARAGGLNITLTGASLGMPTIAQVQLIDSWQGQTARARFAFGPQGETQVNTSALRLKLDFRVSNLGTLLDGLGLSAIGALTNLTVNMPLIIDIGAGSANIGSISCGPEAETDARVSVNARAGELTAYLGNFGPDAMSPAMPAITAAPFDLVPPISLLPGITLIGVKMNASVGPLAGAAGPLDFRQGAGGQGVIGHPPSVGTSARINNQTQLAGLFSGLRNNLHVNATLLNVSTGPLVDGLIGNVGKLVADVLNALGVDALVNALLSALGIQLGFADVWVTGVRCGVPVLV